MPLVTHFCGVCGCRVPPADLDEGQAVILNHVTYCRDCAAKAGIETRKASSGAFPAVGPRSPSASGPIPVVQPWTPGPSGEPRPGARQRRAPARAPAVRGGNGLVVGGVLAGLALVLVIAAIALLTRAKPEPERRSAKVREESVEPLPEPPPPEPVRNEENTARDALRRRASDALAEIEGARPRSGAGIPEVQAAHRLALERVDTLRDLVGSEGDSDPRIRTMVDRGEAVASTLAARIDDLSRQTYEKRVETVRAYVQTKNFDRALRLLKDVPPGFESTTWGEKLSAEAAKVEEARQKHLRELATARDPGWTYVSAGDSLDDWSKHGNASWRIEEDPLGFRFLSVTNPGPGEAAVRLPVAEAEGDCKVRVDLRGIRGELAIHVRKSDETRAPAVVRLGNNLPDTEGWWTLQIDVAGKLCELRFDGRLRLRATANLAGELRLVFPPSGRAEIRNVRVKRGQPGGR